MNAVSCELNVASAIGFAHELPTSGELPTDLLRSRIRENSGANPQTPPGRADKPHARGLTRRRAEQPVDGDGQSAKPHARGLARCDAGKLDEPDNGQPRPADAAAGDTIPDDDWSVVRLGMSAQEQSERIAADERQVTPAYWLLGKALNAARKHFPRRGTWEKWLGERGIGEDRAQKARRLATFFATPDDLAGLSLREALRLAKGGSPNPATAKLLRNFDRRMRNAVQAARQIGKKVERGEERAALLRSIRTALDALAALHCQLTEGETR